MLSAYCCNLVTLNGMLFHIEKTEEEAGDSEKEEEDDDDKIIVRTYPPEVAHSIRGWTARAGCFVAEKMAFFERLSSPDNTKTVRKTTFFER